MSTIEKKSLKVGKYVNTDHVDTIIRNYKKERWLQNSERIGKEDTTSVWLTAEELEEFVQTAKMHGANAIRLCFGVYGDTGCHPGMEGKQTVAIVATSSEYDNTNTLVQRDVYIERNGKPTILAYNVLWPGTSPTTPPTTPPIGTVMIADKEKGLQMI